MSQSASSVTDGPRDANLAIWEELSGQHGFADVLTPEDGFRYRFGTKQAWANKAKPGIYFWIAEDGEGYVGQSVRPQSRLRQHMKHHADLVRASFFPCPANELDHHEQRLISEVGKRLPIRNIKHAVSTASGVPFDRFITPDEQNLFLSGRDLPDEPWREQSHLTQLQAHKFGRFLANPHVEAAIRALRTFGARAIPKPAVTEARFWSATIQATRETLVRVNAGQQEVFTFFLDGDEPIVRVLTTEPMHKTASHRMPYQTPCYVTEVYPESLEQWLKGRALRSARALVVQLMRHTQALNSGSHCPQALRK